MTNQGVCPACNQPNAYTKIICDFCGARLPWAPAKPQPSPIPPPTGFVQPGYHTVDDDAPSTLYAVVGFLIPLVGFILYLVENGRHPQKAASAGKGALWGFGIGSLLPLLIIMILSILGNRIKNTFVPPQPGGITTGFVITR